MIRRGPAAAPSAGAIDLGSTVVKAAVLTAGGELGEVRGIPAPTLSGADGLREGDGEAYAAIAERLLEWLRDRLPAGSPLGLASQRSTFLLWDRETRAALVPMISWQDRRAARWCARNADLAPTVVRRTGLVLSAHYVGPKLATLLESDLEWAGRFREARSRFGTLDSFVTSRWCGENVHETDVTMAARTAMFDLALGEWDESLLRRYAVPRDALPSVRPSVGRGLQLDVGLVLRTSIADQAAAAVTLFPEGESCSVIVLGTGAFVMRPATGATERIPGYLCAPVLAGPGSPPVFVQEGPVNGAGSAVDRFGVGPTPLPRVDPAPEAFCIPDAAGLGAPFWRPDIGFTLSSAAERLAAADLRRVAVEGVLFRVRQVLEGLNALDPGRILLAGGLTREASVPSGLATLLGRPVHVLDDREAVLLGTARLAAGLRPSASPPVAVVGPGPEGAYLRDKYPRWQAWLERRLVRTG